MHLDRGRLVGSARRLVVKVGSGVLGHLGAPQGDPFARLAREISLLLKEGREVILVSSGAVLLGREKLGLSGRPKTIPLKQAAAAAGQSRLMRRYEDAFSVYGVEVAQILLTHSDLADRSRFLNARRALQQLLACRVLPIINENDTVATEELKFGDNDHLSSLVVGLISAELLVILSDIDALYERDPKTFPEAKPLRVVRDAEGFEAGGASATGTGGMRTKVKAAEAAARFGVPTVLCSGLVEENLLAAARGEEIGTLFLPGRERLRARKHWIAFALRPKGALVIDEGAKRALVEGKKSLLPSGIKEVRGAFALGEPVSLLAPDGQEIARGLAGYSAEEIEKIRGKNTAAIEEILGYRSLDEVVHRDDLVILSPEMP